MAIRNLNVQVSRNQFVANTTATTKKDQKVTEGNNNDAKELEFTYDPVNYDEINAELEKKYGDQIDNGTIQQ